MWWYIENFKGVKSARIDLNDGHSTLLTGINSSGKSSIIQSLLLAAQSVYNEGPIVLNGPLVRLGGAQDLIRQGPGIEHITFGVEHDNDGNPEKNSGTSARYTFVQNKNDTSLKPQTVVLSNAAFDEKPLRLGHNYARESEVKLAIAARNIKENLEILHLKTLLGDNKKQLRTYVLFAGFLPSYIIQLQNSAQIEKTYKSQFSSIISQTAKETNLDVDSFMVRYDTWIEFQNLLTRAVNAPECKSKVKSLHKELDVGVDNGVYSLERKWKEWTKEEQQTLLDAVAAERGKIDSICIELDSFNARIQIPGGTLEHDLQNRLGNSFKALLGLRRELKEIGQRVQYLGPLRDEPRVVWSQWNELTRGLPVGVKGEYAAAVLSRFEQHEVRVCLPGEMRRSQYPLIDTVNSWLEYLEIGDRVATRARGKLGVGFNLELHSKSRDLTAVGVGVSQALPLIVGLLSAPANSIFIVEQPELHLHPAMQARLADFLLSSRPDLCLVIETHSESLITRIRRRVSEGHLDSQAVNVVFIEPEENGSTARSLGLNEMGDFGEWPKNFLSVAEEDVRALMLSNMKRAKAAM